MLRSRRSGCGNRRLLRSGDAVATCLAEKGVEREEGEIYNAKKFGPTFEDY